MASSPPEATHVPVALLAEEVEIDDTDSALGDDDTESAITSITSSIRDHTYENGRRYHSFRSGKYWAPNDDSENDRLDMHHHLSTLLMGGKLGLAPISENPSRILDVACGTGIWSIDAGDQFPSAEVIGVDLSPTQPPMVPPNVQFEVDDIEEDWTYRKPFDYIHLRFLAGSLLTWDKLARQAYEHTAPGGWVEFKDWDFTLRSSDDSVSKESYLYQYHELLRGALTSIGGTFSPGPALKELVEKTGFENIHEEILPVPLGMWPKKRNLKEIGAWNLLVLRDGLEAISYRLFTTVLKWSMEETQVLIARVREELKSKKVHGQYLYHVVYAQKPKSP